MAAVATAPDLGRAADPPPATRWLVLLGAIIVQLVLGTVYGYSIFWTPLEAKVYPPIVTAADHDARVAAGQDVSGFTVVADAAAAKKLSDAQQANLKYAFAICILSFALVMVIAGRLQDVTGPRLPAVVGAVLLAVGFLVAGLMSSPIVFYLAHAAFAGGVGIVLLMIFVALFGRADEKEHPILRHVPLAIIGAVVVAGVVLGDRYVGKSGELDELFLLWGTVGFLAGAGIGFAYVCPIAALIKWFPRHKGLVSGLAVAGFGFGAYLFKDRTVGALAYISARGILEFFLVHGVVCLVLVTFGALLLRNPPGTPPKAPSESSWQDTLRRPAFYTLWLMFFSGALAGLMVIGIIAVFAGEQLVTAQGASGAAATELMKKGAAAVGYLAIFNAVGRIFWGLLSDRIGRTVSFVIMFAFQAVMMFMLAGMRSELSLAVAASIVGFNFGGNFALFPSATADLFGAKNLGANYGWVFTSYGIAGVAGIYAGNTAKTMTGSYQAAFVLAGCLCILSAVLAVGLQIARKRAAARPA
jgi:OFA family oxalate/formate antiporter-like MFS transporter